MEKFSSRLFFRQGVVLLHPFLHVHNPELAGSGAGDNVFQARVDNHAAAHGAGLGVIEYGACGGVLPGQIEGAAGPIPAGGGAEGQGDGFDGRVC